MFNCVVECSNTGNDGMHCKARVWTSIPLMGVCIWYGILPSNIRSYNQGSYVKTCDRFGRRRLSGSSVCREGGPYPPKTRRTCGLAYNCRLESSYAGASTVSESENWGQGALRDINNARTYSLPRLRDTLELLGNYNNSMDEEATAARSPRSYLAEADEAY